MRALLVLVGLLLAGCAGAGDGQPASPAVGASVRTGAEVLSESGFEALAGRRVGLIANQTSRAGSAHLADLMAEHPDVRLTALFGPEHGLRGEVDRGQAIEDGVDDSTGTPIYSLYGDRRAPDPEILAGLDVLVFDMQDIGARFYTYIATMGRAMQAAAEAGIPFMVLDRPNPLGGEVVDGFVLETGHESFVGPFPIPVQHGLTVGELARMVRGQAWIEHADELQLIVVPMEGWTRSMLWPDTGLDWIATSPNIPDFTTALVYPGMCYLEATTLNEGRGTEHPFLVFGAPDLQVAELSAGIRAAGIELAEWPYTPVSMPGRATSPRHQDTSLQGIRMTITDPSAVRPLALGMQVLSAVVASHGTDVLDERWLARLAGTDRLYDQLVAGATGAEIVDSWAEEVEAFREARAPYLLYP